MINFFKKIPPEWTLRLGLGLMYLYSSYDIFFNTQQWKGYIPGWFFNAIIPIMTIDTYLKLQAIGEFAIALVLLAWFLPKRAVFIASFLAAFEILSILIFVGIDRTTFRDIGLLGAAVGLFLIQEIL